MSQRLNTSEQALEAFLHSSESVRYSFAYELLQDLGPEFFMSIMFKYFGKTVTFPSKKEFDAFFLNQTTQKKVKRIRRVGSENVTISI